MTESIDDSNNTKLISLKKFFIFNSKYGSTEGEVFIRTSIIAYHYKFN